MNDTLGFRAVNTWRKLGRTGITLPFMSYIYHRVEGHEHGEPAIRAFLADMKKGEDLMYIEHCPTVNYNVMWAAGFDTKRVSDNGGPVGHWGRYVDKYYVYCPQERLIVCLQNSQIKTIEDEVRTAVAAIKEGFFCRWQGSFESLESANSVKERDLLTTLGVKL